MITFLKTKTNFTLFMETPSVTSLRKYIFEWVILGLCGAVIFLFYQYSSLNSLVRDILIKQNADQQNVIKDNTKTLEQVNNYFYNTQKQLK